MSERVRLLMQCVLAAGVADIGAFGLLALLHAHLNGPPVHDFDLGVQAWIHGWSSPFLTYVMRGLTFIGSIEIFIPTLIVAVVVLLLIGEREQGRRLVRKREVSGVFALGIGGAMVLNEVFKVHFHRARPKVPWSIGDETTFSFPSGHSLFSLVLYGLIAYMILDRRSRLARRFVAVLAAGMLTLGIGVSRIYLGMHYPTDVLAGFITGGSWLAAVIFIDRRWRTHWRSISKSG